MKQANYYRKLTSFFMLAGLLISSTVRAEFNFTSINDTLVGPGSIAYDIDNNGTADYRFEIVEVVPFQYIARVITLGQSTFLDQNTSGFPNALDFGDEVSGTFASGSGILGYVDDQGEFKAAGDKYLGIRIDNNGYNHYGWVMLNINQFNDKMIIKSGAYNTNPGETIYAGQTNENLSTSNQIDPEMFTVYPNPCADILTITVPLGLTNPQIMLFNQNGQEVMATKGNDYRMDVSELPMGVYFVQIKSSEMTETRKIVIR